jgi:hypothetical protein
MIQHPAERQMPGHRVHREHRGKEKTKLSLVGPWVFSVSSVSSVAKDFLILTF